jgi:nucleoside-diphosphate-sugar epimerase
MSLKRTAIVFGGTGFIGTFFSKFLLNLNFVDKVYLLDIESPQDKYSFYRSRQILEDSRLLFVEVDVRKPIDFFPPEEVFWIANFAAIHREPGHDDCEYFYTNMLGAQNVCEYAEKLNCKNILFTSSISPY